MAGLIKASRALTPPRKKRTVEAGNVGFDNPRENIDPHIKTKAIDTKEIIQDGVPYDLSSIGAPEGTSVLSTGEGGASKFLREDGDGTSSWQSPAGGGDVTAAVNLTDETIVQGDGGAKGVKTSTATVAQVAANVAHAGTVSGNPHVVLLDEIGNPGGATALSMGSNDLKFSFSNPASDGFNIEAIGAYSGDLLHVHQHTGNPGAVNLVSLHAIDTDVTPLYIENAGGEIFKIDNSGNLTLDGTVDGIDIATDVAANTTHRGDNTQAHTDYLLNSGTDIAVGPLTITADNSSADQAYVPMVLYNTDDTPPAANGFPIGTLYVQYTA